jgi:hypothetical protein
MPVPDLNQGFEKAKGRINSIKAFTETSSAVRGLKKSAGNSASESVSNLASQLDKISTQQKRFQRNAPTSFDQLLDLIGLANGTGKSTTKYLRKILFEVSTKIEPEVAKILTEEGLNAIGCSQEQTFQGISKEQLQLTPLNTLPVSDGIYVPVQSVDVAGLLKNSTTSPIGKALYELKDPSVQAGYFKPYGGERPFPMNKELNLRMDGSGAGQTYYQQYGAYYQGVSGQDLFDYQFTKTNGYGVTQDCFRVILVDRTNPLQTITGGTANKVGEWLQDYYKTIKIVDSVDFGAALVNLITGAISIKSNIGVDAIDKKTQFSIILQRILGLCFDSRREIDVSGVAKVAELDGVDDSFYRMTEVDLRNIDITIDNIKNGVVKFEDCNNVSLPVDYDTIVDELIKFRSAIDGQSIEGQVKNLESLIDTVYENPEWKAVLPTNLSVELAVNKDALKKIPLALASAILSPKALFPIFVLMQVVQKDAVNTYNQAVTSANTYAQSGSTIAGQVNNLVNNQVDFLKVFKQFNIQVTSKVGAIYIRELFNVLKRDIINLLSSIIADIDNNAVTKRLSIILRLVEFASILAQLLDDFRKCQSLVDEILKILGLLSGFGRVSIPAPLLLLTDILPGTSSNRSTINTIELLQSVGIPTGALPDGSPNLMNVYNFMTHKGAEQEQSENGKIEGQVIVPPISGGILRVTGKWL